ncbi:FAD/FMN-containing isoamyl alcohol oxidase-like protein MreA [Plenodomus tracheiphilus IPT5]|uniref:FAD/FMN-containing isoamyl alcohol oxidase-like protein MreA n=1 Tax=Plenodomus tracheiphilus IPT5 TaxID=1408161 RepID=A0A6A7B3X5_9PLEO|nr:FAD/FMN-containing isoamyl alcohol oxidase-like protein MreA [Plenodomus tracheiphilus IPT5]
MSSCVWLPVLLVNALGTVATPVDVRDATLSFASITPAATTVPTDSPAGINLFSTEAIQLTDAVLETVGAQTNRTDILALIGFDDNASSTEARKARQNGSCKTFPGDWDYPLPSVWSLFDAFLGGALIKTTPVAAPCYKSSGVYDAAKCADISARFTAAELHTSDPTSMMWPLFQGRTCQPTNNPNDTCTLGGYPSYSINVQNVAQIQLGINFARNRNLRLVVKNTGHDYIGKSSGAGALSLWTHNLKEIRFLENYQNAEYSGPVFKAGAGVQGFEILEAARDNGVTVLAGICETVGWAGGYVAGGGHSPLASIYGMAADQVLAFEVVTADGRLVTASNTVNRDLFWALRGGGGSTFGVVTSAIVKAHPKIKVTKSVFSFQANPNNSTNFWKAINAFFKSFPTYTNAGTYSYFWIWNYGTSLSFQMTPFFAPNHTIDSFNKLTQPLFAELSALNISITPNTTFHEDFYSANKNAWGQDTLGVTSLRQATRLFPKSLWETPEKFNNFYNTIKQTVMDGHTVGGYHMAPGNPFNIDNAVNPAWRTAQSFLITANMVPDDATPAELKTASDTLTYGIMDSWRGIAPSSAGGGVYLNEADIQEPHWQEDFYGARNYQRLLAVKRRWDPQELFYAATAVGSESWEVRDGEQGVQTQNGRLCRV